MRLISLCRLLVLPLFLIDGALNAAPALTAANVSVGRNLQAFATVALSEPAPAGGVAVTLTSSDPKRLLLSNNPETPGAPSLTLTVKARFRETPEFWLQSLGDSGEVTYTAAAPGYSSGKGTVTLSPSGLVIIGPMGESAPQFITTPRGWDTRLKVSAVRLDPALHPVEPQFVRAGYSLSFSVVSSDPKVGAVTEPQTSLPAATESTVVQFKPAGVGKTSLTVKAPPEFRVPATLNAVEATVKTPGIAVADDMTIGENLQLGAAVSLGEPAPGSGVKITLTSSDPKRLLLATKPDEFGKPSIEIQMPAGSVTAPYYLQALDRSGVIAHSAKAEGYTGRTGTLGLAPSGVILTPEKHGPPDEAEVFRPESAGSHRNHFVALLSEPEPKSLTVYTAFLDPRTRRSADITVQPLRGGLSLSVDLKNTNPAVATIEPKAVIKGGHDRGVVAFKPAAIGETVISIVTPQGFTTPSNATEILAIVQK